MEAIGAILIRTKRISKAEPQDHHPIDDYRMPCLLPKEDDQHVPSWLVPFTVLRATHVTIIEIIQGLACCTVDLLLRSLDPYLIFGSLCASVRFLAHQILSHCRERLSDPPATVPPPQIHPGRFWSVQPMMSRSMSS